MNATKYIVYDSFWIVCVAFFCQVVLKRIFMFRSCKSEKLVVFIWYRQDQKGTGGTEKIYFLTVWRNKGAGRHGEVCLRLGRVESRGRWTMYYLRFALDGIRSLFRLVVFFMYFHVQIKQSCISERLVVFFWCRQDQKGTGETEGYIF